MRLLTYNVHGCIGRGGNFDPDATIDVIEASGADVIALQEVHDGGDPESGFLAKLHRRIPCVEIVRGVTMRKSDASYGNVLLSRIELDHQELIDLSLPGHEPRGAIRVRLRYEGHQMEITATHLGLAAAESRAQINRLLGHGEESLGSELSARILLGDLNEWWPLSRANRKLRRHYGPSASPRTFPTRFPLFPLDRIHIKSDLLAAHTQVLKCPQSTRASDHLPLIADLKNVAGSTA